MTAPEITALLRATRLQSSSELMLQNSIGTALGAAGIPFEAEARLSAGSRIDFLCCGSIGIEAKAKYPKRAIYRQLARYARHDSIQTLILVTGTAMALPAEIEGKPVFYVSLGRAAL